MSLDDMAPLGYQIYPGSTPEFRLVQKTDGTFEQHVRYIRSDVGYVGRWMKVETTKEGEK